MKSWWNGQTPSQQLGVFATSAGVAGVYFLVIERAVLGAAIAAVTVWVVGCLAVSTAPVYRLWAPKGRFLRLVKGSVDIIHSIRYGRGQRLLGVAVTVLVVVAALLVLFWTVWS